MRLGPVAGSCARLPIGMVVVRSSYPLLPVLLPGEQGGDNDAVRLMHQAHDNLIGCHGL